MQAPGQIGPAAVAFRRSTVTSLRKAGACRTLAAEAGARLSPLRYSTLGVSLSKRSSWNRRAIAFLRRYASALLVANRCRLRTTSSRAYSRFSQAIRPSPRSSETTPAGLRPARSDCNSVAPLDGRDRVELDARGALGRRCPRLQRRRGGVATRSPGPSRRVDGVPGPRSSACSAPTAQTACPHVSPRARRALSRLRPRCPFARRVGAPARVRRGHRPSNRRADALQRGP